jgi:hypothetical protein
VRETVICGPLSPLLARHVDADAGTVGVVLARHLLFRRQDRLNGAEVDMDHPGVRALLDDAGDDVALSSLELAEHLVVADVAQPLVDDLLCGERSDAAEVARNILCLADDFAVLVQLRHEDAHVSRLSVEGHARLRVAVLGFDRSGVLEVGRENRLLDDHHEFFEGNFAFALHEA